MDEKFSNIVLVAECPNLTSKNELSVIGKRAAEGIYPITANMIFIKKRGFNILNELFNRILKFWSSLRIASLTLKRINPSINENKERLVIPIRIVAGL